MGGKRVRACAGPAEPHPHSPKKTLFETIFNVKNVLFNKSWNILWVELIWNSKCLEFSKKAENELWFCSNWKQFQLLYENYLRYIKVNCVVKINFYRRNIRETNNFFDRKRIKKLWQPRDFSKNESIGGGVKPLSRLSKSRKNDKGHPPGASWQICPSKKNNYLVIMNVM